MAGRRNRGLVRAGVVVTSAVLVLSACSSGSDSGGDGSGESGSLADNPAVSDYKLGTLDDMKEIDELCPDEKVVIGYADGINNPWRASALAEMQDEAAKCGDNVEIVYTNAQGDTSKAISDIEGLVARGVDAIVTHADAGPAVLPAIQAATDAGVIVVTNAANVGGEPGKDFLAAVGESANNEVTGMFGELYTNWMVEALDGKGKIVHLGGPAGNPFSEGITEGMNKVLEDYPDIEVLEENVTTNYDPAECQKVTAGLLAKYPQIDGIVSDYGACTAAALRAFDAAKRPMPPSTGDDQNVFACTWDEYHKSEPTYEIAIGESRPWRTRLALRRALAGVEQVAWDEPTDFAPELVANSLEGGDMMPACDPNMPPDAFTKSSFLTPEQLKEIYS